MSKRINILPDGTVQFIHADEFVGLIESGDANISRTSHVEPTTSGQWTADMSPVGGPEIGPYRTREEALSAEVSWLQEERGL